MSWSWSSARVKAKQRAQVAVPPPDPAPFTVPDPGKPIPYVAANPDYANNAFSPNYRAITTQQKIKDGSFYPKAGKPPEDFGGYERWGDYERSLEYEHQINGREGLPLIGSTRYRAADNPYSKVIPNTRVQRQPHEYDFERPFDQQNPLGARNLNGNHFSEANIGLTNNPSTSLKGMSPARRKIPTFRLDPTEYGENTVATAARQGPPSAVYTSPDYTISGGSYRLS